MQRNITILAVCFLVLTSLQAQVTTATIEGTVTDSSGSSVPSAEVVAINSGTNQSRTVTTNASGGYRIDLLPSGAYDVEVTAHGFKKFRQNGIILEINRTSRVDAALTIGALTEEVTITTDPSSFNTSKPPITLTTTCTQFTTPPI